MLSASKHKHGVSPLQKPQPSRFRPCVEACFKMGAKSNSGSSEFFSFSKNSPSKGSTPMISSSWSNKSISSGRRRLGVNVEDTTVGSVRACTLVKTSGLSLVVAKGPFRLVSKPALKETASRRKFDELLPDLSLFRCRSPI